MGLGRSCLILTFPMLGTVVAVALTIVMLLGSTKQAPGLKDVYYMRIDVSNITDTPIEGLNDATGGFASQVINDVIDQLGISDVYDAGVSGYCEGEVKDGDYKLDKCHTGDLPYWFDLQTIIENQIKAGIKFKLPDDVKDYEKILKTASKAMWVCYVIGVVVCGLTIFIGLFSFHSRIASFCTALVSFVGFLAIMVASALGTGIYKTYSHYFNEEVNKYGIKASLNSKALAITWVATAAALWATVWWVISICCGHTARRNRIRGSDYEEKEPFIGYVPHEPHYAQSHPAHPPHY